MEEPTASDVSDRPLPAISPTHSPSFSAFPARQQRLGCNGAWSPLSLSGRRVDIAGWRRELNQEETFRLAESSGAGRRLVYGDGRGGTATTGRKERCRCISEGTPGATEQHLTRLLLRCGREGGFRFFVPIERVRAALLSGFSRHRNNPRVISVFVFVRPRKARRHRKSSFPYHSLSPPPSKGARS